MARTARAPNPAMLGDDAMSSEESALMDADRNSEGESPEPTEEAPIAEPEAPQAELPLEAEKHEEPAIDPKTGKERVVNYGALHAEREKRKAAEGETAKAREETAKIMGRFETIQQLVQRSQQPKPTTEAPAEIPDINLDPVGHFQALYQQSQKKIEDIDKWRQTQEGERQAMNNVAQLQRVAQSHEVEFKKANPDYDDAFQYVRKMRDQELEYMGYADPGIRQQIIQNDALQIAAQALQGNKNAAEVVYNIAKARGWAGKAPNPAPSSVTQQPAQSPDAKKIATVAKGQAANQSLGQVGGEAPLEFSAEMIAKMPEKEFEAWIATNEDAFRKMMGG